MQHTTFLQTILPTFSSIPQELSKTYGLGYALLQRMGFRAGDALKPGALAAPLAARANLRRKGLRQGANEERRVVQADWTFLYFHLAPGCYKVEKL